MTEIALSHAAAMPMPQGGAMPTALEWQALERMATMLADSDLVPYRLKRKPGDIAVILLAAREYGVPPLMALSKLPVVNGTPAPMGELMVALVLRAGHKITAKVRNADGSLYKAGPMTEDTYGECVSRRAGDDEDDVLTFTLREALDAGLVDRLTDDGRTVARITKTKNGQEVEERTPWEQYPANMLRWRAVANACRLRFPDVLLGLSYLPEELGATVDADGAPIVVDGQIVEGPPAGQRVPRQPAPTIESRTAAEFLEQALRLAEVDRLRNGAEWAERNGIAGEVVTVASDVRERLLLGDDEVVLSEVLAAIVDHVAEGKGPVVMDPAATAESAPQEPAAPPSAPEQPEPGAQAPSDQPAPQEGAQPSGPVNVEEVSDEELAAAVRRTVPAALTALDVEVIRRTYAAAKARGRAVDVAGVLDDDDRDRLGIAADVGVIAYGALLMAVAGYLERHGTSVRAPLGPDGATLPVEDPPGDGWPDATATPSPLEHH